MNINKLKEYVHKQMNYSDYESSLVRNDTNCYAHAIGATFSGREMYRIGAISKLKPTDERYVSNKEIKTLFLEDMKVLDLGIEEVTFESDEDCVIKIEQIKLDKNQYVVALFSNILGDNLIHDFHFWRFDEKGFSEKRWGQSASFIDNPSRYWMAKRYEFDLVGVFIVTM